MDIGESLKNILVELQRGVNVKMQELKKSQSSLQQVICLVDDQMQNMKTSVQVSEQKYALINEKLNRVPLLKKRVQNIGSKLLEMHSDINTIKQWITANKKQETKIQKK